jgi:predicted DNA-binding protein (MmcQ/YjbR family)
MAAKNLHDRKAFTAFAGGLTGAVLNEQWEALVAKVGGKVFCLRGDDAGVIVFKVSELAFDGLVELPGIAQAAYFAKRQWVRVEEGALEDELLKGYIRESHRIIASKLTRKARAELGL